MDFSKIMEKIEREQLESFKTLISEHKTMDVDWYLCLFLGTFLSRDSFPQEKKNFEFFKMKMNDKEYMRGYFDRVIDSVSLCEPEIIFFHKMVKLADSDDYIKVCLKEFDSTSRLKDCQLGPNIKKCLEASDGIVITHT